MFCNKCVRELGPENFYQDKNAELMPTCKKCISMHVNVHEPSTVYHILKIIDIPFIPSEWENLVNRYAADPRKAKVSSVLGRYISKMKLAQYMVYRWEDTDRLIEEHNERLKKLKALEEEQRDRYSKATGAEAEDFEEPDLKFDFGSTMTRMEKDRMIQKWGRLYKEEEWVQLEDLYNRMHETYEIKGASHEDYLKMICKTSLKMNQAIDTGDIEGFNKLGKNYDQMMRSAKFTAAQDRSVDDSFIGSIGEMVRLCEAEGFIPRYHTDESQDIVDLTLKDITKYLEKLVKTELNLGSLIDATIKQMERENEEEDTSMEPGSDFETLEDDDFLEFSEFLEEEVVKLDR